MSYRNKTGEYPDFPALYLESWMHIITQPLPLIQECCSPAEAKKIRVILNTIRHKLRHENSPLYPELQHIRICVKDSSLIFETLLPESLYALAGRPIPPEARFGHQNLAAWRDRQNPKENSPAEGGSADEYPH